MVFFQKIFFLWKKIGGVGDNIKSFIFYWGGNKTLKNENVSKTRIYVLFQYHTKWGVFLYFTIA